MTRYAPAFALLIAVFTAGVADAQPGNWQPAAQPQTQIQTQHKRAGLIFGFAVGSAIGAEEDNHTGALGSIYVGGMVNPKLAVMFNLTGFDSDSYCWDCSSDASATDIKIWGGAAQMWLSDRLWFKGTLGIGTADVEGVGSLEGLGWGVGSGIDIISGQTFALDARLEVIGAIFDEGSSARTGVGIGFSWR